jgi:hypothetical protein
MPRTAEPAIFSSTDDDDGIVLEMRRVHTAEKRRSSLRVSARFGSDRPSAGDVPDAAPVDAPARARPARLGPRARTVS